jgi:hypothetical protein
MNPKKSFILVVTFAVCLFGLQTSLLGQEPNDIAELKVIITNLEKQIEQKNRLLEKIKKDLIVEREEKERLIKLCREAGVSFEKTGSPVEADYQVCQTSIKPGVISDSMETVGFTKIAVGEVGWIASLKIQQIIDSNNAIVEIGQHTVGSGSGGGGGGITRLPAGSAIPSRLASAPHRPDDIPYQTVWLKGIQTNGFADDTRQTIHHYFAVTGTKTYQTAIDSDKTLYVIEPVILSPKRLKQETLHYEELKKQMKKGR